MDDWLRDIIAEEQGLTACAMFAPYTYGTCNRDCKNCELLREFDKMYDEENDLTTEPPKFT